LTHGLEAGAVDGKITLAIENVFGEPETIPAIAQPSKGAKGKEKKGS
jgi:hypothetical protein